MEAINRKFKDAHKYANNWVWMYAFSLCYILFSGLIGFYSFFAIFTCIPLVLAIIFTVQRMMICKSDPNIGMNKMQIIELTIHTLFLIGSLESHLSRISSPFSFIKLCSRETALPLSTLARPFLI